MQLGSWILKRVVKTVGSLPSNGRYIALFAEARINPDALVKGKGIASGNNEAAGAQ